MGRDRRFYSLAELNAAIGELRERLNEERPLRRLGVTRRQLLEELKNPQCTACNEEINLTVFIPPFGSPYGLKVYTCAKCGRSIDYLVQPRSEAA